MAEEVARLALTRARDPARRRRSSSSARRTAKPSQRSWPVRGALRACSHRDALTVWRPSLAADAAGPGAPPIPTPAGDGADALLVLRRELTSVGGEAGSGNGGTRSACRVNGRAVPLRVLRALGAALVDVNGQGAAAALDSASGAGGGGVLALLDARARCSGDAARFGAALVWARTAEAEAASSAARGPASEEEAASLAELAQDVAAADVAPGEDGALRARLRALEAHRASGEAVGRAAQALENGALDALRTAARELRTVAQRLPEPSEESAEASESPEGETEEEENEREAGEALAEALAAISDADDAVEEANRAAVRAVRALRLDAAARDAAASRLRALEKLCKKHGVRDADALIAAAAEAEEALAGADGAVERCAALAAAAASARAEMAALGVRLARRRAAAARRLESAVDAALDGLCMPGARFRVALRWEEADSRDVIALTVPDAADVGRDPEVPYAPLASGLDRAALLLAPAPGEPLRPLAAAASGGERARVMLALKAAAAAPELREASDDVAGADEGGASGPPVSLFDEVDSGVGGAAGGAVGAALRRLAARGQQVLCVTHLPQVAAFAERHVSVAKAASPADGRPTSRAAPLANRDERAAELAAMLGLGADAGKQLLDAADAAVAAEERAAPQAVAR
jgi:DNA repair ATPase RecN